MATSRASGASGVLGKAGLGKAGLAGAVVIVGCAAMGSPVGAAKGPTSTRPVAAAKLPKGAVKVTFDTPGASPRPIRETVVALKTPRTVFVAVVEKVTYAGLVCGFTFKGVRPVSPATIRVTGTSGSGRFDSGELKVEWDQTGPQETSSASAGDQAVGWNFLSAANVDRSTGAGWVISAGAVPQDKKNIPSNVICTLTMNTPAAPGSGPVGYWAGFATS